MRRVPKRVIAVNVNGEATEVAVWPHTTLLEALRYGLRLTGSKQGCDKGDCGACTVRIDGKPMLACLTLAVEAEGRMVATIEGLAHDGVPDAVQVAFDRCGALQCGFCQSGMMIKATELLESNAAPTVAQIKEAFTTSGPSPHLCRCGSYTAIIEAVQRAATVMGKGR